MTTSAICGRRICSRDLASAASIPTSFSTTIDYLKNKLKAIGYAEWNDVKRVPCHTLIPAADKYVMQYPPGTGFVLALFPRWISGDPALCAGEPDDLRALRCLRCSARATRHRSTLAAVFGLRSALPDDQPEQGELFGAADHDGLRGRGLSDREVFRRRSRGSGCLLIALVGLLIGLSVNFRLPNLFLAAGYCLYLAGAFLLARSKETFLQGIRSGSRS